MTIGERFVAWTENALPSIIGALAVLLGGMLLSKIVLGLMNKGLKLKHVDTTIHKFLMSMVKVIIYVFVAVTILSILKVPMSSVVAAIGTAGLTLGLALKDSLSNIAGGFIILFSKPFRCGDYIKIGTEEGTVDEISMLYTRLLTIENSAVYIPNSAVASSTVVNVTAEQKRKLDLKFSISYSDDHAKAMEIIGRVVASDERCLKKPDAPLIALWEHGDSAIVIVLRVWVETPDYWPVRFSLLQRVKEEFDQNGITIPFDQLDIHLDRD